ncbi:MAG: hypothetical protein ACKV2T_14080 [Kofleriaceae bacterium]
MSVLFVLGATACGGNADGGSPNVPDAPAGALDAGASADGAPFQGLTVDWADSPPLPGPLGLSGTTISVASARFRIERLEAISDGGAVPEARQDDFDILWDSSNAPPTIYFPNAPPAIYSKVRLNIDQGPGDTASFEITGSVVISGTTEPFRITSQQKIDLEVEGYAVRLDLGDQRGMPIIVKLDALLAEVAWSGLPVTNTVRTLDDTRPTEIDALRDRFELAFVGPFE